MASALVAKDDRQALPPVEDVATPIHQLIQMASVMDAKERALSGLVIIRKEY